MTMNNEEPSFYEAKDVMDILKISRPTLNSYISSGALNCIKIGRKLLFDKRKFQEDLARFQKYQYAPTVREKFPPTRYQ